VWLDGGDAILQAVDLTNQAGAVSRDEKLKVLGPRLELNWDVRLHDRATVNYKSELMLFSRHAKAEVVIPSSLDNRKTILP
jgi:hypothetical protein